MIVKIIEFLKDIKVYIAIVGGILEGFFGPSFPLLSPLIILAGMDILVGFIKNRKLHKEKLQAKKLYVKFSQILFFFMGLAATVVADEFLIRYGWRKDLAAEMVCSSFGIYQLLHIYENLIKLESTWLQRIKERIIDSLKKDTNNEDKK